MITDSQTEAKNQKLDILELCGMYKKRNLAVNVQNLKLDRPEN